MLNPVKETFFQDMANQGLALTFDDVRLRTSSGRDSPPPDSVDITSRFSRNEDLKIPYVSAAMDTVTTADMAIAMAKLGGLGVIHAGLSIESQKYEVRPPSFDNNFYILSVISLRITAILLGHHLLRRRQKPSR